MTIAAIDAAHRPAGPSRKAAPAPAAAVADRAMQALRAGRLDAAWLWADKLCRMVAEPGAADAYLLRSAVFALRGDRAEAEADLRVAARIDPEAPAVNRALLASYDAAERLAAARRLLGAADAGDRDRGYAALSRDGFNCVGLLEHAARHLRGRLAWNGLERIAVQVRTDVVDQRLELRAVQGR